RRAGQFDDAGPGRRARAAAAGRGADPALDRNTGHRDRRRGAEPPRRGHPLLHRRAPPSPRRRGGLGVTMAVATRHRSRLVSGIAIQLLAMLAIGLLIYPEAADWFARLNHNAEISGYVEKVAGTPDLERRRILDAAYEYNETLQPGPLTDPYVSESEDALLRSPVYVA